VGGIKSTVLETKGGKEAKSQEPALSLGRRAERVVRQPDIKKKKSEKKVEKGKSVESRSGGQFEMRRFLGKTGEGRKKVSPSERARQ